jgi:glycosyltransferase involved in cell wall biosynthesis
MRYAWDGREAYLAHWSNQPIRRAVAGWILDRLREWDRETSAGVTHFIGISQTVRERIAAAYRRECCVIEPPVDTDFYTPRPSVQRESPYLCLSALVSYKRIDHAIAACRALDRELLIIGDGPDRQRLESISGPGIRFLGWQPDEHIRDQLRRCRAVLFPGEEDFGIVPLEAMATGTPVIALGRGGARETVADVGGALYETPTVAGLKLAIERWESRQSGNFDPVAARARATLFSADRFRARMHAFLAKVVRSSENSLNSTPHFKAVRNSNHNALW